jgi:hypothetical protein
MWMSSAACWCRIDQSPQLHDGERSARSYRVGLSTFATRVLATPGRDHVAVECKEQDRIDLAATSISAGAGEHHDRRRGRAPLLTLVQAWRCHRRQSTFAAADHRNAERLDRQ